MSYNSNLEHHITKMTKYELRVAILVEALVSILSQKIYVHDICPLATLVESVPVRA